MKKTLLLTICLLLLTGCSQISDDVQAGKQAPVSGKTSRYRNEELNISFEYPANWKTLENERSGHAVNLISADDANMYFDYQSESFDEYENKHQDLIKENKISIKETRLADHPAREYGMEGAINYIIELDGRFVLISTESGLTEEQKDGLGEMLNSLSFQ